MKTKNLKNRLISAVLVLVMSFSMFVGATYAWFTDSVTSAGNKIEAGNLSVDLLHKVEDDWVSLKKKSGHKIFDYDNWEPGYTRVETLKVQNLGSLALKYKLSLTAEDGTAVLGANGEYLADVIEVYVCYGTNTAASFEELKASKDWTYKGTLSEVFKNPSSFIGGSLLPTGKTLDGTESASTAVGYQELCIALHMKEEAGNEYMNLSAGNVFVNLIAAQMSSENDSFGNGYDELAPFPAIKEGSVSVPVKVENGAVSESVSVQGEGFNAYIPEGVKAKDGADTFVVTVEEIDESKANIVLQEGEVLRPLNVHVEGVAEDNDVPIIVDIENALAVGYNSGNYKLAHVEGGSTNDMTIVNSISELDEHNECYYDPATGKVYLSMAGFSEVVLVADTENAWNGTIAESFAGGAGTESDPYLIANADQLAYLGKVISNDNEKYGTAHYKLIANVNLGGEENADKGIIFYPIGYTKVGGEIATADVDDAPEFLYFSDNYDDAGYAANRTGASATNEDGNVVWYTYGGAFKGTFDGNGNTISNIYQNTWQLKGNYDGHYWNAAMGVFGYVYGGTVKNLTVDNFSSDGEFTPTGVIAAYAAGNASFENIAITNCNPRVYNTGNGGIVGIGGSTSDSEEDGLTFTNITIDNSNKISALWGSWDVACGGLVGMFRGPSHVYMNNCHVGAQIDVYNDVCGNYQYYWYRYSGMLIGTNKNMITDENGYTVPETEKFRANDCTVHFGKWNDYYYCELVANTLASYTHDHQFSRLTIISSLDEIKSGDEWTKTGNYLLVSGDTKTCYHIVNKDGVLTQHNHADAGTETVNGENVLKEDKQIVYLPFNQLFTGYGWGVKHVPVKNGESYAFDGVTILDRIEANSIDKFEAIISGDNFEEGTTITIGEIFKALDGVSINANTLMVFVSPVGEDSNASAIYVPNTSDWTQGTLTFTGVGAAKITITDYTYCKEATTSIIIIEAHEHSYDNACDTTCNICDAVREVIDHVYDNDCDATCNECGAERTTEHVPGSEVKENITAASCTAKGSYDEVVYCTCCKGELSRKTVTVDALGHKPGEEATCTTAQICTVCEAVINAALGHNIEKDEAEAPGCESTGLTEGEHCTRCDYEIAQEEVAALGHNIVIDEAKAPGCESTGLTEGKHCTRCDYKIAQQEVAALGHAFEFESKFNKDFLYRVGNQNTVSLSALFNVNNYDNIEVVISSKTNNSVSGTYSNSNKAIQFTGTGVVAVTVTDKTCGKSTTLNLEVVDAKNIVSATSSIDGTDVVLLNDVKVSSGGTALYYSCTVYGNGFTFDVRGGMNEYNSKQGHGIIITKGATIDNLVVVGDVYNTYGAYTNQADYTGAFDATNTTFTNCYIANCATPIRANGVTIINTTLYGGTVANLIISGGTNTLTDVITVNYNDERNVLGLGIIVSDEASENTKIVLNGTLKQYNYVCSTDVSDVPGSDAKNVFNSMFGNSFSDYHIGSNPVYVNTGIVIMTEELNTDIITDNAKTGYTRNDNAKVTFTKSGISKTVDGAIYAPGKNTTIDNGYVLNDDPHISTTQGHYLPNFDLNLNDYYDANDGADDTRYCYESIDDEKISLLYQEGQAGFTFDLTKLASVTKFGFALDATVVCKDSNGNILATNSSVALKDAGIYYFEVTVKDNIIYGADGNRTGEEVSRTYVVTVELSVKKASWKNAEITLSAPTNKSGYNSSKYYVLNFLEAISITDYAEDGTSENVDLKAEYESYEISYVNDSSYAWSGFTLTINYKDGRVLAVTFGAPSGLSSPGASAGGKTISLKNDNTYGYLLQTDGKINTKVSGTWPITKCTFKGANTVIVENTTSVNISVDKNTTITVQSGSSSGGSSECVTPDTLITLADGSQVRVDSLTGSEELLVWNMETGKLDKAPIMFIDSELEAEFEVIKLYFSDSTEVKVIYEHGFWDYDLNKYVYLDVNAADYIGHTFAKQNGDSLDKVQLVDVVIETELTTAWSPVTAGHLCYFVNGMLSMPGGVGGLFNIFEVNAETMTYDYEQMQKDIETYGLFTYEELNAICPLSEEMFNAAGGAYLKISIGKGNLTMDELIYMINRYSNYI